MPRFFQHFQAENMLILVHFPYYERGKNEKNFLALRARCALISVFYIAERAVFPSMREAKMKKFSRASREIIVRCVLAYFT